MNSYIIKARLVILMYFESSNNLKFLYKTFEYAVKEIVTGLCFKNVSNLLNPEISKLYDYSCRIPVQTSHMTS